MNNQAYVLAYYPQAFAKQVSPWGNVTKGWHVYIENVTDVSGKQTWHFSGKTAALVWQEAAEAVQAKERRRIEVAHPRPGSGYA